MLHIYRDDKPDYYECVDYIQRSVKQGIRLDLEYIDETLRNMTPTVEIQKEVIENKFRINNLNSSVQIKNRFMQLYEGRMEELGVCKQFNKKSRDMQYSFSKESLEALVESNGDELADGILKYREASGVIKSLTSLRDCANKEGMVYPNVNIGETGRISYSNPALASINKDMMWDILGTTEYGNGLYIVDISQQEPWILMHWYDIEQLKELVAEDPEKDFYNAVSVAALGEKVTGDSRSEVKRIWNALTYGASANTLVKYGKHIDANKIVKYFNSIPEIVDYKKSIKDWVYNQGLDTVDTYFGRTITVDDFNRQSRIRKMLNYGIQGTAADIMVFLVNYLKDIIEERELEDIIKLRYTIYDAIVLEVSGKYRTEDVIECLSEMFEHRIDDWLPFKFKIKREK